MESMIDSQTGKTCDKGAHRTAYEVIILRCLPFLIREISENKMKIVERQTKMNYILETCADSVQSAIEAKKAERTESSSVPIW